MPKSEETIIDKFKELKTTLDKDNAKVETNDKKEVKEDKAPETKVEPKAKEETKDNAKKEPQKEPEKQEVKAEPEKAETKVAEPKVQAKEPETKVTEPKAEETPKAETVNEKAASTKDVAKDKKVEKNLDTKADEHKSAKAVDTFSPELAEQVLAVVTKSYKNIIDRLEKYDDKVESIQGTVDSMKESLIPFVSKAMKLLPEDEVVNTSVKTNDPEAETAKSVKLEDEQHAESLKKSTKTEETDKIAKDDTSTAVDEVIEKSNQDAAVDAVKTQAENPEATVELSAVEYKEAAKGMQRDFFNKMRAGLKDGTVNKSALGSYQLLLSRVQDGSASVAECKKFIDFTLK